MRQAFAIGVLSGLVAACSGDCEVICTRFAECSLLAEGTSIEDCRQSCMDAFTEHEAVSCATCLDTSACSELARCDAECPAAVAGLSGAVPGG